MEHSDLSASAASPVQASGQPSAPPSASPCIPLAELSRFSVETLLAIGADDATAQAATRAMMHGTRHGVDSHGIRLLPHYVTVLEGGRVNRTPSLRRLSGFGAVMTLDADHAHGALAAYTAMDNAIGLAGQFGIGAVAIRNTSHFGPAGTYSLEAARQGFIGLTFCNSDSFVRLHDGAERFHGTNPIAVAVPAPNEDPWLLDMATSAVPFNRVLLYRSLGLPLPEAVASDQDGLDTTDAHLTDMLAPVGAAFGFKGAALAGMAEIFSAVLTGMRLSFDIAPMGGPDVATPRQLGAFTLAIKPDAFVERDVFDDGMRRYLHRLRHSRAREGQTVLAPGDREWAVARLREKDGVQLDPDTAAAFQILSTRLGIAMPPALKQPAQDPTG
ncbi:Ldh family oxidoreductase [Rhizobium sp. SSA_523]|uniref:Ldh family oxidoreductase n=1 Tax=Rhizobium sp. SSA_523 TaxID=2952477 RepID=UPI0020913E7A|nr:Ldh family oxidoreductase [Rhizobium sp. SSA_523]MCO5734276.1 Ldh family oxidoreductase [Rhizobium sp. SSA_523]WKC21452.1 Ldh family oxidoreductase [Rhizobium sp. SSA_523]